MNKHELKQYLQENELEDRWRVMQSDQYLDNIYTVDDLETLSLSNGVIYLLHEAAADQDSAPWIEYHPDPLEGPAMPPLKGRKTIAQQTYVPKNAVPIVPLIVKVSVLIAVIALTAGAGFGYFYYSQQKAAEDERIVREAIEKAREAERRRTLKYAEEQAAVADELKREMLAYTEFSEKIRGIQNSVGEEYISPDRLKSYNSNIPVKELILEIREIHTFEETEYEKKFKVGGVTKVVRYTSPPRYYLVCNIYGTEDTLTIFSDTIKVADSLINMALPYAEFYYYFVVSKVVPPPNVKDLGWDKITETKPRGFHLLINTVHPSTLVQVPKPGKPNKVGAEINPDALIIVENGNEGGVGFICKIKDNVFIVTNIHLIANNSKITYKTNLGKPLTPSTQVFLSKTGNVAIIPLSEYDHYLELEDYGTETIKIDDAIVMYGSTNDGVLKGMLKDRISGIGPDKIEIGSKFFKGHSGSPVINTNTGKVLGIASFSLEFNMHNVLTQYQVIEQSNTERQIIYRLDNITQWSHTTQTKLNEQYKEFEKFKNRTIFLDEVIMALKYGHKLIIGHPEYPRVDSVINHFAEYYSWDTGTSAGNVDKYDELKKALRRQLEWDIEPTKNAINVSFYQNKVIKYAHYREELQRILDTATEHPIFKGK